MYVKVVEGIPVLYSIWALKNDNPNTSFPSEISNALLKEWSVYPCVEGAVPELYECEQAVRGDIINVNGVWTQTFTKEKWPLYQAEQYVREKRNTLLSDTDWMALSDVTLAEPWAAYRQALRDITLQTDFPYGIVWPQKPE